MAQLRRRRGQDGSAVSAHAGTGLLAPESGPAPGHPGSSPAEPWRFVGDFSLHTETRMPATAYTVTGKSGLPPLNEVPGDARPRADERRRDHSSTS